MQGKPKAVADVRIDNFKHHPPAVDDSSAKKNSNERDFALAQIEAEKRISIVKAWEENEKSKATNKAEKKIAAITSWENTKKAKVEGRLRKHEETMEEKKAVYAEKMKNKAAMIHKEAEEKRVMVIVKRDQEILKVEEFGAKYRAIGSVPAKSWNCFG